MIPDQWSDFYEAQSIIIPWIQSQWPAFSPSEGVSYPNLRRLSQFGRPMPIFNLTLLYPFLYVCETPVTVGTTTRHRRYGRGVSPSMVVRLADDGVRIRGEAQTIVRLDADDHAASSGSLQ